MDKYLDKEAKILIALGCTLIALAAVSYILVLVFYDYGSIPLWYWLVFFGLLSFSAFTIIALACKWYRMNKARKGKDD